MLGPMTTITAASGPSGQPDGPIPPAADVRYAIVDSVLGRMLVATTSRGVCALALGDSDVALEQGLRADLRRASIARDEAALGAVAGRLVAHLAGAPLGEPPALDLVGTAFQRRVWRALLEVARGSTCSYADLASAAGLPASAARAVARACAQNPVAVLVPCHRVVRGSGGLAGYRWGVERKARLLAAEGARLA